MLPTIHKILFFIFALIAGGYGAWGFYRLYLRLRRGAPANELRWDHLPSRIGYAILTALTQERTFRKRPVISVLHALIFYGFTYYLLVNVIDGLEGYFHLSIRSDTPLGAIYNLLADLLSFLVLVGVIGLLIRRVWLPSRRDFRFTPKTLLHPLLKDNYILRDSLIVSAFITFHVGSRALGNAARMVAESREFGQYDLLQPFASGVGSVLLGHLSPQAIENWRIFGFWGALGSILAFLSYFPYTKHIHIFMTPLNYAFKRPVGSGVLPPMKGLEQAMESEEPRLGAEKLEDLEWPRLLDAYACIQCNRCQDVCPANATGKALSPAALEINKRMELNVIAAHPSPFTLRPAAFETGAPTDKPLLEYAIDDESVWACTTCGACMQVCPVQNEQMLDIVDIRRHQVMVAGEFPPQLQTAFRGMERASNPWGISRDKRMEWAEGLKVPTIDENPEPDVLYWVGCAASYDPGAQKVARSFVQLLDRAGVNYAVLGKKEACTGDSARRSGNEFLYQQLAQENVETLNQVAPKLIVATCPHCMNAIGNEYKQIGGDYRTIHHTEYLETLVAQGKLPLAHLDENVTYHDPCYLGRHNGVFAAPRDLISRMAGEVLELERQRENSFCCGAGGAQFWKEEEEGRERVSDNRFREIQARLDSAAQVSAEYRESGKVLAVGCPFCKAMMNSTPEKQKRDDIIVKDVAELLLESVQKATGDDVVPTGPLPEVSPIQQPEFVSAPNAQMPMHRTGTHPAVGAPAAVVGETNADHINQQPGSPHGTDGTHPEAQADHPEQLTARKAWKPKAAASPPEATPVPQASESRKTWKPKGGDDVAAAPTPAPENPASPEVPASGRKTWQPKRDVASSDDVQAAPIPETPPAAESAPPSTNGPDSGRKAWKPKASTSPDGVSAASVPEKAVPEPASAEATPASQSAVATGATGRKAWEPKAKSDDVNPAPVAEVPAQQEVAGVVPRPETSAVTSSASAETAHTPSSTGRAKWTPKGKAVDAEALPSPSAPSSAASASVEQADAEPITEHLHLNQVAENTLEEGQQATSEPGAGGRKKWMPKKKV